MKKILVIRSISFGKDMCKSKMCTSSESGSLRSVMQVLDNGVLTRGVEELVGHPCPKRDSPIPYLPPNLRESFKKEMLFNKEVTYRPLKKR